MLWNSLICTDICSHFGHPKADFGTVMITLHATIESTAARSLWKQEVFVQNRNSQSNKDPCDRIRPPSPPAHQSVRGKVHNSARQPNSCNVITDTDPEHIQFCFKEHAPKVILYMAHYSSAFERINLLRFSPVWWPAKSVTFMHLSNSKSKQLMNSFMLEYQIWVWRLQFSC